MYTETVNKNEKPEELSHYYDDESIHSEMKLRNFNHSLNGTIKVN